MPEYLLLIAAGAFWICGIVGVCVLYYLRRAGRRQTAELDFRRGEVEAFEAAQKAERQPVAELQPEDASDPIPRILQCVPDGEAHQTCSLGPGSSSLRFPYRHRQWVAACVDGRMPEADDFLVVECQELFGDGVSFYSDSMCSAGTLVITLGTHNRMIFMLARVISEVSKHHGSAAYLVECRFVHRIRENTGRWARALSAAQAVQLA